MLQPLADRSNRLDVLDLEDGIPAASVAAKPQRRAVVVCASGFHGTAKAQLQAQVVAFGATYVGDLVYGVTTHLVCRRLLDAFGSAKYRMALQWGIHVVSHRWVLDSLQAGHPLPADDHKDDGDEAMAASPQPCPAPAMARTTAVTARGSAMVAAAEEVVIMRAGKQQWQQRQQKLQSDDDDATKDGSCADGVGGSPASPSRIQPHRLVFEDASWQPLSLLQEVAGQGCMPEGKVQGCHKTEQLAQQQRQQKQQRQQQGWDSEQPERGQRGRGAGGGAEVEEEWEGSQPLVECFTQQDEIHQQRLVEDQPVDEEEEEQGEEDEGDLEVSASEGQVFDSLPIFKGSSQQHSGDMAESRGQTDSADGGFSFAAASHPGCNRHSSPASTSSSPKWGWGGAHVAVCRKPQPHQHQQQHHQQRSAAPPPPLWPPQQQQWQPPVQPQLDRHRHQNQQPRKEIRRIQQREGEDQGGPERSEERQKQQKQDRQEQQHDQHQRFEAPAAVEQPRSAREHVLGGEGPAGAGGGRGGHQGVAAGCGWPGLDADGAVPETQADPFGWGCSFGAAGDSTLSNPAFRYPLLGRASALHEDGRGGGDAGRQQRREHQTREKQQKQQEKQQQQQGEAQVQRERGQRHDKAQEAQQGKQAAAPQPAGEGAPAPASRSPQQPSSSIVKPQRVEGGRLGGRRAVQPLLETPDDDLIHGEGEARGCIEDSNAAGSVGLEDSDLDEEDLQQLESHRKAQQQQRQQQQEVKGQVQGRRRLRRGSVWAQPVSDGIIPSAVEDPMTTPDGACGAGTGSGTPADPTPPELGGAVHNVCASSAPGGSGSGAATGTSDSGMPCARLFATDGDSSISFAGGSSVSRSCQGVREPGRKSSVSFLSCGGPDDNRVSGGCSSSKHGPGEGDVTSSGGRGGSEGGSSCKRLQLPRSAGSKCPHEVVDAVRARQLQLRDQERERRRRAAAAAAAEGAAAGGKEVPASGGAAKSGGWESGGFEGGRGVASSAVDDDEEEGREDEGCGTELEEDVEETEEDEIEEDESEEGEEALGKDRSRASDWRGKGIGSKQHRAAAPGQLSRAAHQPSDAAKQSSTTGAVCRPQIDTAAVSSTSQSFITTRAPRQQVVVAQRRRQALPLESSSSGGSGQGAVRRVGLGAELEARPAATYSEQGVTGTTAATVTGAPMMVTLAAADWSDDDDDDGRTTSSFSCMGPDRRGGSGGGGGGGGRALEAAMQLVMKDNELLRTQARAVLAQQARRRPEEVEEGSGDKVMHEAATPEGFNGGGYGGGMGGCGGDFGASLAEMPTCGLARGDEAMRRQLGVRLAHLERGQGDEEAIPLKMLLRPARGSGARHWHGLGAAGWKKQQLQYAEQIQVPWARATFSTKERSHCAIVVTPPGSLPGVVAAGAGTRGGGRGGAAGAGGLEGSITFVAEPVAFYQLPSGGWWMECHRFLCARDLRAMAKARRAEAVGRAAALQLRLPADYRADEELMRSTAVVHVPLEHIKGEMKISRVRKPGGGRGGARAAGSSSFWWRFDFDEERLAVVVTAANGGGNGQAAEGAGAGAGAVVLP